MQQWDRGPEDHEVAIDGEKFEPVDRQLKGADHITTHPSGQTDPLTGGAGPLIKASGLGSPMTGDFTVADDASAIGPIVVSIANRFAE